MALKWVEPSDGQQHLLAAKAMSVEEVIRFGARREAGIDRIGKHPHTRRIGTVQREKTPPREPAHGGNQACTVRGPALPPRRRSPRLDAMQLQPQRSAQISGDDRRERRHVVEHGDEIHRLQAGQDEGAGCQRLHGARRTLERAHAAVGVQADDQAVAQLPRGAQGREVPDVQQVEAAAGGHHHTALRCHGADEVLGACASGVDRGRRPGFGE